ncbi:hypothetical protein HaLaN_10170 [Haematococcus lacustris]|uniref:Uncharacterized protein n=1 Tax=Haematococcus lacustris TaxID=44745 RepID=A0A699YV84_HAELA|nr:hypothetical protein HaLaN_10170 [Haematococcus lacustris]
MALYTGQGGPGPQPSGWAWQPAAGWRRADYHDWQEPGRGWHPRLEPAAHAQVSPPNLNPHEASCSSSWCCMVPADVCPGLDTVATQLLIGSQLRQASSLAL